MNKRVTVIGGLNMDIKAKSKSKLVPGDSNPSHIEISAGGVGRNIAHNLALLGVPTILLSAAGNDGESESIIRQTQEAGVNMEHLLLSQTKNTGKYIALLDDQGEMAMAVSDMDVLEELNKDYLHAKLDIIENSDMVVCDTNLNTDCIKFILEVCRAKHIPVCIDPVSAAKAVKLFGLLEGIYMLTPNQKELQILSGTEGDIEISALQLVKKGVQNIITTLGPDGLCHTDANKSTCYPTIAKNIVDVTGAGDSLTAGLIYGLLEYQSFEKACQCGLAAASITLSSSKTVSSRMSKEEIAKLVQGL